VRDSAKDHSLWLATGFACFLILLLRGHARLFHPDLWAEEAIFTSQALSHSWFSLFFPVAGSYHTLQRILVILGLKVFPWEWFPYFLTFSYLSITAFVFSLLSRKNYDWLIPRAALRVALAIALCFVPGFQEMLGNMPNLNWVLWLGLVLLLLQDPATSWRAWRSALVFLIIASVGTIALVFPLFAWRLYWEHKSSRKLAASPTLWLLICLIFFQLLVFIQNDPQTVDWNLILWHVPRTWLRFSVQTFLLQPWLGDHSATKMGLSQDNTLLLFGGALIFIFITVLLLKKHNRVTSACFVLLFPLTWPVLCWLARPGIVEYFKINPRAEFWRGHYAFPNAVLSLLFWTVFLMEFCPRRLSRWLPAVFLALFVTNSLYRFEIPRYGEERRWSSGVPVLRNAFQKGCSEKVFIPVYPEPWGIVYEGGKECS
jgi:hypothetical protein